MWLSDYKEAIEAMEAIFGNCCFTEIKCSFDGERILFCTSNLNLDNLEKYAYYRKTGRIIKYFNDTWRTNYIEVIKEGK